MEKIRQLLRLLDSKQARNLEVLDMRAVSGEMDYMIVSDVDNPRLLKALAHYVMDYLDEKGFSYRPVTHLDDMGWILIDAQDVILHLFLESERNRYQLEKLWQDRKVVIDYE